MTRKYTCIDCAHVCPESQLIAFKDRFGMLCKGCPKCGCDDLDEDSELMDIAQARMDGFCHSNEFGERIPHIIALTPVDSSPVIDKILDAMEILL